MLSFFQVLGDYFQLSPSAQTWRETWPFGPGYSEGFVSVALKLLFEALIFLFIAGILRFLFGPGGWLRDKEFDEPDGNGPKKNENNKKDNS